MDEMDVEQIRAATVVGLLERVSLPSQDVPDYVTDFSDDVLEGLFLDRAESLRLLADATVQRLGGRSAVRDQALQRLASIVSSLEVHHLGNDEVGVTLVTSDSVLAASTVLLLPQVLAHAELGAAPHGVFVATPTHSELLVHPLRDARSLPSLQVLAQMARAGFDQGAARLSPHVHWWDGTSFTQLTRTDDEGTRVEVGPELGERLDRLAR